MSLIDLITGSAGSHVASRAENKYGISKNQVIALLAVAAPLVISYLRKKSQENDHEAEALKNALDKDHSGEILNDPDQAELRQQEGNSILTHIFGPEKQNVENHLSQNTGISMDKIGPILGMLAPLIMGYIGKQKQSSSGGGIGDLLGSILGGAQNQAQAEPGNPLNDILGSVLGGNSSSGGGNPLNDLLGNYTGGNSSQSEGLGGLLGGLFGGNRS